MFEENIKQKNVDPNRLLFLGNKKYLTLLANVESIIENRQYLIVAMKQNKVT